MPIYEFYCGGCEGLFETLVLRASAAEAVVCPTCGSGEVHRRPSTFGFGGAGIDFKPSGGGGCGSCAGGSCACCARN
ncbi:MAG: zinc ribbon domain-containing protein [Deltaproteobacteria bacterium]|nr:zinc ribbon domain-containing protein [Deltaproteobacteria bacterium]MBI3078134.1 zinc ribbon domain-containing protein [Deltaproteobacteria bacterium]